MAAHPVCNSRSTITRTVLVMSGTRSRASFSGPSSSATTTSRLVHVKTALKKRQTTMNQGGTNRGNYYYRVSGGQWSPVTRSPGVLINLWFFKFCVMYSLGRQQRSILRSMPVAYSDSHPTMYVVHGRAKPVLHGPNSTESYLFRHGETTYRVG